jgi:hypothetical protein
MPVATVVADREALFEPLGHCRRRRCVGLLEDDRELVAADPAEDVAVTEHRSPAGRGGAKQAVAGSVTLPVV